jgi:hypothetical protein
MLALVLMSALAADPPPPPTDFTGTWHWTFTMPDGTEVAPKIKLKQEGNKVTGISSLRAGTDMPITNGVVTGNEVHFEVVRQQYGLAVTTRYSGKLEGKSVRGRVESDWAGQAQAYPWEARRYSGIEGTWKWTNLFGGRPFESRVTLNLDGDKLTGSMPSREGRSNEIKNASFIDNEVIFEVERGRGDFKFLAKHQGTLEGDTIVGEILSTGFNGESRTNDWEAFRVD